MFRLFLLLLPFYDFIDVIRRSELLSFHKVTKSVCTGTRAIVRTLPSGRISEDVCAVVVENRFWHPSKEDMWPILVRGEEFRGCREILRFSGESLQVKYFTNVFSNSNIRPTGN